MPVLLLALALSLPALAESAKSLYAKGQDAEARQNYEQAYDLKPKDIKYRTSYERTKFLSAASHVHRGQIMRDGGKLQEALAEFERAAQIDPSSFIAQQEIRRTRELIDEAQNPKPQPPDATRKRVEGAQGPVELKPVSETPITLHMTDDIKVLYQTLGKLAGINVLFDPQLPAKRISIDVSNVTLAQALQIVALQSKTFWRPVTSTTIYVAEDTAPKRKEVEQSVVKTFYLQNLSQPTDIQDINNMLRQIVAFDKMQPLNSLGAIVVRGTPDQVALAEKLISDLDKAKPEVVIEVAVMGVSRDKIRELGINPPQTATVQLQSNVSNTTTTGTGTTTTTTGTPSTTGTVTLNKLANLTAKDFLVTIDKASLSFLYSDANTKIIQNPQIRALDNQKATLKIGDRIPVATGSFQPGIGGIGINPLVNTQFQYQDVGVNIDMTPQIHQGREVTLKMTLEISSVTGQSNIGGVQQPIIGQRKLEQTIRLKDGEINLMGGILQEQEIKNVAGYPFLSQIPLFKYLFSQEHTERHDTEIVFAIIPHIVRAPDISELNTRAIDVGTANAIELRYNNNGNGNKPAAPAAQQPPQARMQAPPPQQPQAGAVPPAQNPATEPGAQPQQPAANQPAQPPGTNPMVQPTANPPQPATNRAALQPPAQPNTQPPTAQPASAGGILSFEPPQATQPVGSTFVVNLSLNGAANLYSVSTMVHFNPQMLQLVNVSNGGLLSRDGQAVALVHRDADSGTVPVTASRPPGSGGISGQGPVFTLTFMAKSAGNAVISVNGAAARDGNMQPLTIGGTQAMITVK